MKNAFILLADSDFQKTLNSMNVKGQGKIYGDTGLGRRNFDTSKKLCAPLFYGLTLFRMGFFCCHLHEKAEISPTKKLEG